MVLHVFKWNIQPDKTEAYLKFAQRAVPGTVSVPGVVEFRAYRPVTGASAVALTYEFADLSAWAAWYDDARIKQIVEELQTVATDISTELWGPSPIVPQPIRPGG
jgi:quinol monooxygenase YgiN